MYRDVPNIDHHDRNVRMHALLQVSIVDAVKNDTFPPQLCSNHSRFSRILISFCGGNTTFGVVKSLKSSIVWGNSCQGASTGWNLLE